MRFCGRGLLQRGPSARASHVRVVPGSNKGLRDLADADQHTPATEPTAHLILLYQLLLTEH